MSFDGQRPREVADNDYFRWELAFPEVFFDEYGNSSGCAAGFDAVFGNPPRGAFLNNDPALATRFSKASKTKCKIMTFASKFLVHGQL